MQAAKKTVATPPEIDQLRIGYARVSTGDQKLHLQLDALHANGCRHVFEDQATGANTKRPGLASALNALTEGSVLVVWRLDRLGRSMSDLIAIVKEIEDRGAGLVSLSEAIDTTSPGGRLIFHVMGSLAEFERALIVERTQAGLSAAKARGQKLGRKPSLDLRQIRHAKKLMDAGETGDAVASSLGVGRATLYRALKKLEKA